MILNAAGLHKSYGAEMAAVSQADILLQGGEFVSIVGRSGSGVAPLSPDPSLLEFSAFCFLCNTGLSLFSSSSSILIRIPGGMSSE